MAEKKIKKMKRDELFAFLPMSNDVLDKFTPENIPKEIAMTFHLKQLDVKGKRDLNVSQTKLQYESAYAISNPDKEVSFDKMADSNQDLLNIVRRFVVGWDNFNTVDGESFPYVEDDKGFLSIECFSQIPAIVQVEIIKRLSFISGLSSKEELGLK